MSSYVSPRAGSPSSPKANARPQSPAKGAGLQAASPARESSNPFDVDSQSVESAPAFASNNPFAPGFGARAPFAPKPSLAHTPSLPALPQSVDTRPQVNLESVNPDHAVLNLRNVPHCDKRSFKVSVQGTGAGAIDEKCYPAVAGELSKLIGVVMEHPQCKNFVSVRFTSGTPPTSFARAEVTVPGSSFPIVLGGRDPKNGGPEDMFGGHSFVHAFETHLGSLRLLLTGQKEDWSFEIHASDDRKDAAKKKVAATAAKDRAAADSAPKAKL